MTSYDSLSPVNPGLWIPYAVDPKLRDCQMECHQSVRDTYMLLRKQKSALPFRSALIILTSYSFFTLGFIYNMCSVSPSVPWLFRQRIQQGHLAREISPLHYSATNPALLTELQN